MNKGDRVRLSDRAASSFTVSTRGPGFLIFLHLFVFFIATSYGIHSLNTARKYLDSLDTLHTPIHGAFLFLWFILVGWLTWRVFESPS